MSAKDCGWRRALGATLARLRSGTLISWCTDLRSCACLYRYCSLWLYRPKAKTDGKTCNGWVFCKRIYSEAHSEAHALLGWGLIPIIDLGILWEISRAGVARSRRSSEDKVPCPGGTRTRLLRLCRGLLLVSQLLDAKLLEPLALSLLVPLHQPLSPL